MFFNCDTVLLPPVAYVKRLLQASSYLAVVSLALLLSEVKGGIIGTRTDLLSQLGSNAVTENFESYLFPSDTAKRVGTELDATSVIDGQGPGLVQPGVRFQQTPAGEGLQWDRQFEYGLQSAALVSDNKLIVDFTTPVTHAGFDFFWFNAGFQLAEPATIQVFATDDVSLLYSTNIFEPYAPNSFFFGFTDSQGIGNIALFRVEDEALGVSPIIDNLTFGSIPEPSTLSLVLLGASVMLAVSRKRNLQTHQNTSTTSRP
jgi:hypothetical protein